jgi:hypothetical protein
VTNVKRRLFRAWIALSAAWSLFWFGYSNPLPSRRESANHRFRSRRLGLGQGQLGPRTGSSNPVPSELPNRGQQLGIRSVTIRAARPAARRCGSILRAFLLHGDTGPAGSGAPGHRRAAAAALPAVFSLPEATGNVPNVGSDRAAYDIKKNAR